MSEEEEDEEFFIPDQSSIQKDVIRESKANIKQIDEEAVRLKALLAQKRRMLSGLKTQHSLMRGAEDGYILYIEQMRARKQPWWWFVLLVISYICILGQWDKSNKILTVLNIFAHKLLWRRMYVDTNITAQFIAICIVAYTFLFG